MIISIFFIGRANEAYLERKKDSFGTAPPHRAAFFFYGGPGYHSARSFQAAWNLGHILYFALVTGWISCGFQPTSLSIPHDFLR